MRAITQMRRTRTGRSRTRRSKKPFGFLVALAMAGCGFASAPLKDTPKIVATPQPGQLNVMTQPSSPIGDVQPVYVSVANGSDIPRSIVPSQIFALDDAGSRVAPLPPGEAARDAGGSG